MEIGTEISKKIRAAIKGKLQELGAYIDEELPDYIMVMVANKKTSQQMADDLSLFLGNNTIKFTAWLHGVLEKLRSVAVEPGSAKEHQQSDSGTSAGNMHSSLNEDGRAEESKALMVSSSRSEARVSSSAYENREGTLEKGSSRLTSTVKPLVELAPSEAVIDIKPEMDDDLIAEDPVETRTNPSRTRSRPTVEIYRPGQSRLTPVSSAESHSRHLDNRSSRQARTSISKPDESRKRKAPVASSVVRVNRTTDEDSDEAEDEDTSYGSRGLSSRVSLPSKPERKPTLPPAKQANRNLILKAISEAQDSITKTTAYPTIPQRQTVPVAPRTRLSTSEEMTAAIQLVQEHLHSLAPRAYTSTELPQSRPAPSKSIALRLQVDSPEGVEGRQQGLEAGGTDTRSFIMSKPQLEESSARGQQHPQNVSSAVLRTLQAGKEKGESSSPKFIVTLDGVPSPLGNFTDCDLEMMDDVRPPTKEHEGIIQGNSQAKVSVLQRLDGEHPMHEDDMVDYEEMDDENVPLKRQKVMERCKFWPACKIGDQCLYHHPTAQCKTFPNCKFGDKCIFIHPNCKYDARCTKPDCSFTHVSRRSTTVPTPRPVAPPVQNATVCRFFPECKKMDCPFYHPKPCRFAAQCKRAGCSFYHPTTNVPPRHALKWTKTQSS